MPRYFTVSESQKELVYTKDEIDAFLNTKADKVSNAVAGNIVDLSISDGNISDSGVSPEDLLFGGTVYGGEF